MELQDFISGTLVQIINGVANAQAQTSTSGAVVSPKVHAGPEVASPLGYLWCDSQQFAQIVQFDVALTTTKGKAKKGGIGILAGAITVGGSGQSSAETSTVNRIKFSVPLILPSKA